MKKILLFCTLITSLNLFAQTTYVPDDNFEQALIDLGYDSGVLDDYVPTANISSINNLFIPSKGIADLTGIEDFTSLVFLNCASNSLSTADVSSNTALIYFSCSGNDLTSLDVSSNINLIDLVILNNQITSIDLSTNVLLERFFASDNLITSLDLSLQPNLKLLGCENNLLTSLNVKNGNNTAIINADFDATNNPNLLCIEVDDAAWSTTNWTDVDATVGFSESCYTYVPDDNFEQALIDLGYDTILDDYVYTENINTVTYLNVNSKNIADLTGIEGFIALEDLRCSNNSLTSLDISANTALTRLWCQDNSLTSLNVSANTALTDLRCFNNSITSLDVSTNTALTRLWCQGNSLTSLDVSTNVALNSLYFYNNEVTNLDVSTNTALTDLRCFNNLLTSLDVSTNTALTRLWCQGNSLTSLDVKNGNNTAIINANFNTTNNPNLLCIEVDAAAWSATNWTNIDAQSMFRNNCSLTYIPDDNFEQALIDLGYDTVLDDYVYTENINTIINLDVSSKSIADLTGIESFVALTSLWCQSNSLASLDISANIALIALSCQDNQLTSLDVSTNTALTFLNFQENQLTSLDVSANTVLTYLNCRYNELTSLDVSTNTALTELRCTNNELTNLDVSTNTALTFLNCSNNQLTSLDVSANTTLSVLACFDNQLTSLNVKNGNNTAMDNASFYAINNPNLICIEVDDAAWSATNWTNVDAQSTFGNNCSLTYVPDDNFEQALIDLGYDTVLDNYVYTENINTILNLDVSSKGITDLTGIEDFVALEDLNCNQNSLTSLDISANINLIQLRCFGNTLTALDVSSNTLLTDIHCSQNQIGTLDLSQNTALVSLTCTDNLLTSLDTSTNSNLSLVTCSNNDILTLDFSQNPALAFLNCNSNNLTILKVKNGNNINFSTFDARNNPNLACIEVDDATWSTNNWVQIDTASSFNENCYTYVPDDNFEQALIDLGYDTVLDDYILTSNINTVTILDVSSKGITDLTGIEGFVVLTELDCHNNSLTSLNISTNTALTRLDCFNNSLTSLDVSTNVALTFLRCGFNQLTSLDVSTNTSLATLAFSNNQLTSLDVSANTVLTVLNCSSNLLTSVDVSTNTVLTALRCQNNSLTNLDVSTNTALINLWCNNNLLISLDVSINASLANLWCHNNQLTSLNVKNGNNTAITNNWFNAVNNPSLTCIEVDDATWSATNWTSIDATSVFANNQTECSTLTINDYNSLENNISMYPNPANNKVTIKIDKLSNYKIFNTTGQIIKKGNLIEGENNLNVSEIRQGIYFVQINSNDKTITKKLIIK